MSATMARQVSSSTYTRENMLSASMPYEPSLSHLHTGKDAGLGQLSDMHSLYTRIAPYPVQELHKHDRYTVIQANRSTLHTASTWSRLPEVGSCSNRAGFAQSAHQPSTQIPNSGALTLAIATAARSGPPPARSRNGAQPTDSDWRRIRPVLERMYLEEGKTLAEIMTELSALYDFRASEQMYKKRISRWSLDKNLKQHEVEHILGIAAQRKDQGKDTYFLLRGRKVNMQKVYRFQRRKKLKTSQAVANYLAGQSQTCRDLQPFTPPAIEHASQSWSTPDQRYENTLRAFGALFHGLVDSRYYWLESNEIVMPPNILRGEVSDVCSNLVASKQTHGLNFIVIRKLFLLLELIMKSDDAWTHCRLIYMLWVISSSGQAALAKALLAHLNGLVEATPIAPCAQHQFMRHYSSLEVPEAARLAADIISLKADMVAEIRVGESLEAFRLRSLDYDVFWRHREQGTKMSLSRSYALLQKCKEILGPLAVETLTVLRITLEDFKHDSPPPTDLPDVCYLQKFLQDTKKLNFNEETLIFSYDNQPLRLEAVSELARVYCQMNNHNAEAWIFERLLAHQRLEESSSSYIRREYSLLVHITRCSEIRHHTDYGKIWKRRKEEIENIWQAEVEAIAPTNELLREVEQVVR